MPSPAFVFPRYVKENGCFIGILPRNKRTETLTRRYRNSKTDKQIRRTLNAFFMFFSFLFFLFLFFQYLSVFTHSSILAKRKSSTVENPRKSLIFSLRFHLIEWSHHKRFCLRTEQLEQPFQTPSFTLRAKL